MPARFRIDPSLGVFGLYTVPSASSEDNAPLSDPLANLSRVIYHPLLRYPGVVGTISGTVNLPAASWAPPGTNTERRTHTLGSHGLGSSARPMVIGRFKNLAASDVPWCGTVCVQCPSITYGGYTGGATYSLKLLNASRWLAIGVSGGNVVAHEMLKGNTTLGPAALSLSYEILILDRDLATSLPSSGPTRFRISGGEFLFESPKGTVSSAQRYIKQDGSGWALSGGRTTTVNYNATVSSSVVNETTFRHDVGTYSVAADYVSKTSAGPTYSPAATVVNNIEVVSI